MTSIFRNACDGLRRSYYGRRFGRDAGIMASQIVTAAQTVAGMIAQRRRAKPHDGQPLFAVLGESHVHGAHLLAHMLAVRELHARGHMVAVGIELPRNMADLALNALAGHPEGAASARALQERINALPPYDRRRVVAAEALCTTLGAQTTSKLRTWTWARDNISLAFNDAALGDIDTTLLDMDDEVMRAVLAQENMTAEQSPEGYLSPLGMRLRNHAMIYNARRQVAAAGADIFIQICGSAHVAGDRLAEAYHPYEHSLTGLLSAAGEHVIGVPFLGDVFKASDIPHEAGEADIRALTLCGPVFAEEPLRERAWLRAVMPHLMPDYDLDDDKILQEFLAGKNERHPAAPAP